MNIDPQSIAPAEPDYSARVRWTFVAILFCLSIVSVIDRHILTLLVVPIQARFGLSDVQMSVMIGLAFALPNGLFSIPIGWAVDRYSRRTIIATGLAIWSLATAATGLGRPRMPAASRPQPGPTRPRGRASARQGVRATGLSSV